MPFTKIIRNQYFAGLVKTLPALLFFSVLSNYHVEILEIDYAIPDVFSQVECVDFPLSYDNFLVFLSCFYPVIFPSFTFFLIFFSATVPSLAALLLITPSLDPGIQKFV
jgi:hypothetical protein